MPMGAVRAPGTFERLMNHLSEGISYVCISMILPYSTLTPTSHVSTLRDFLDRPRQHNSKVLLDKIQVGSDLIDFLGRIISPAGLQSTTMKVHSHALSRCVPQPVLCHGPVHALLGPTLSQMPHTKQFPPNSPLTHALSDPTQRPCEKVYCNYLGPAIPLSPPLQHADSHRASGLSHLVAIP